MIKVSELRIGNIIFNKNQRRQKIVTPKNISQIIENIVKDRYVGVPLSADLFQKTGFKIGKDYDFILQITPDFYLKIIGLKR